MRGNVWQWCSDLYAPESSNRIIRGGGWRRNEHGCNAASRAGLMPDSSLDGVGFRVARSSVKKWEIPGDQELQ